MTTVTGANVTLSGSVRTASSDIIGIAARNLRGIQRRPRLLIFSSVQPVMFVLLFRYVFGGAIRETTMPYVDFLLPGIFVQVSIFGGSATAVGLAEDLNAGVIDRFRTLPMARTAVLAGRTLADLVRNVLVLALMIAMGTLLGFRFHGTVPSILTALLLVLAFGYAFSWVFAAIGLAVRDPETAQVAGFLMVFPLVFASSVFVPVATMPGWLQAYAKNQPISVTVDAVRALTSGTAAGGYPWQSLAWIAGILTVFISFSAWQYSRTSA